MKYEDIVLALVPSCGTMHWPSYTFNMHTNTRSQYPLYMPTLHLCVLRFDAGIGESILCQSHYNITFLLS